MGMPRNGFMGMPRNGFMGMPRNDAVSPKTPSAERSVLPHLPPALALAHRLPNPTHVQSQQKPHIRSSRMEPKPMNVALYWFFRVESHIHGKVPQRDAWICGTGCSRCGV